MTQIATQETTSIQAGPRGIGARTIGGAYSQDSQLDIQDGDSLQGPPITLTGTTDAIGGLGNFQTGSHVSGNYVIETAGVDAITLPLPTVEIDDNLSINVWSDTANAHTVTLPSAGFATGAGMHSLATFAAQRGAGMTLRAWNGSWQVISASGITFSA